MGRRRTQARTTWRNAILCGDALEQLRQLPAQVVDTVVTSPPYYRQRDYTCDSSWGTRRLRPSTCSGWSGSWPHAAACCRDSGSLWIVLGDKYCDGQQLGMPWRVALALMDDGWILRSDIIWHKPNAMPSAVKTRPTTDHEYVFFLTKSKQYYYDADAIREPHVTFTEQSRMRGGRRHFFQRDGTPEQGKNGGSSNLHEGRWDQAFHPKGRNKRTVWSIPLSKFREAHFAVYPGTAGRELPAGRLSTARRRARSVPGQRHDGRRGAAAGAAISSGIDCVPDYCHMAAERLQRTPTHADR